MLSIEFKGFFECRLATDADHFEEKRGTNLGWTFATPDEADLDRRIRFQPGLAVQRRPGVDVGVHVSRVMVDGVETLNHPLNGAKVDLIDDPIFDGRNGQIADAASEPIFPFHIQIVGNDIQLSREMRDAASGDPAVVLATGSDFSPALFDETNVGDPSAYRDARLQAITDRIATEADPTVKDGLVRRQTAIQNALGSPALMWGPVPAQVFVSYNYRLSHPAGIASDPLGKLPGIDTDTAWQFECSLGAWDADVLSGFAIGKLHIPLSVSAGS